MRNRIACAVLLLGLLSLHAVAPSVGSGEVVINEIAWAGRSDRTDAEWIELCNTTGAPVDLTGWRLVSSDGSPSILLQGWIAPLDPSEPTSGFFLLERESDDAVPGLDADLIYHGALSDRGEILYLYDEGGRLIDTANAQLDPTLPAPAWAAGTGPNHTSPFRSMERLDYRVPDTRSNWASGAADAAGAEEEVAVGTPKRENSVFNIPPTAILRIDPPTPRPDSPALFDAFDSTDPNNRIQSFAWLFGDGERALGQTASHIYRVLGEYTVSLTVTDEKGATARASETIEVVFSTPPIADFSVLSTEGRRLPHSLENLRFLDESYDEDGPLQSWAWDFGDGNASDIQSPSHVYSKPGTYQVRLTIVDRQGERDESTQSIVIANRPPMARISPLASPLDQDVSAHLDASVSSDPDGRITRYLWDLDSDGQVDEETAEPTVDHAFKGWGEHRVTLVVVDDWGEKSLPATVSFPINAAPIAQFQVSSSTVAELAKVAFTSQAADPDGTIASYSWTFGDGTACREMSPTYAYQKAGTYLVTLRVADARGIEREANTTIHVVNLEPRANLNANPLRAPTSTPIALDASGSFDPSPSGAVVRYEWDTGDGEFSQETTESHLSVSYAESGTYCVRVRVTDDSGATAVSDTIQVAIDNRAPRAGLIRWTPSNPTDDEEITLSAAASDPDGEVVGWRWEIPGATPASGSGSSMTVCFPDDGVYVVSLTVTDDDGRESSPVSQRISVRNSAPIAAFDVSQISSGSRLLVRVNAAGSHDPGSSGRIAHVAWDFGDGTSCPGSGGCTREPDGSLVHEYTLPGVYVITLVVIDDQGLLGTTRQTISVHE